jgi:DNA helicase-2/ATP-dependent DNA helicase PcrA
VSFIGAADAARLLGMPSPTPEQAAVIEAPLEPLLVVAGAGSGKTETMTARVVHLVANGLVERDRVLGLTFTRKAAGELADRVRRRLHALDRALGRSADPADALVAPTVSTYNSYAAGIVGEHALRIGVEPSARLLGEAARWQLAHDVVERWSADLDVDLAPTTVTAAVLDLAGALAEHLVTPDAVRDFADRCVAALDGLPSASGRGMVKAVRDVRDSLRLRSCLMDLVEEFTARKRRADLMDFADQVALAARLAREVPDVGVVERSRFAVVLLDEYQDTSVAQLVLLRHLFGDLAGPGTGHPVTAVGDPYQSIYGWRGASSGGLERFPAQFPCADGRPASVLDLSTSWRNDCAVLDAANVLAGPLRADSARVRLAIRPLGPRPGAGAGEVVLAVTETVEDEAREVAAFVARRRVGGASAAVLCRRRAQFPLLHAALLDEGLPVEVVGLGGLLDAPEVVDVVAGLEAAHDPSRGDSLMRLLTGPRARLGLADLHALADWSGELARSHLPTGVDAQMRKQLVGQSIVDALDELPPQGWVSANGRRLSAAGRERLADVAGLLRRLRSLTYLPVADLAGQAEQLLGLDIEVAVHGSSSAPRAHLDAFRVVAAQFDAEDGGTLGGFLAWLSAARQEERGLEAPVTDLDPDAVQLMTVHAAKGLEWDVVAVPGLVQRGFPVVARSGWVTDRGSLPTALRGDRDHLPDVDLVGAADLAEVRSRLNEYADESGAHHLAEERRLVYVAVTRARSDLMLAGSRWRDGVRPTALSVFLQDVVDAAERSEVPVVRAAWAPDPVEAAAEGVAPTRPERPPGPPVLWPPERPSDGRTTALGVAGAAVREAIARETAPGGGKGGGLTDALAGGPDGDLAGGPGGGRDGDLAAVADLLLEERRRREVDRTGVRLPAHLSASAVVQLAADPDRFARQLRRPVPLEPSARARRGTAFHAWVEAYFGAAALVDVETLPGADDETIAGDEDLADLQRRFLESEWAQRTPLAVEVDVETPVGEVMVRSRIDAVFAEPDGGVVVVDWKTGRPPSDPVAVQARELQLAAYRLAWSRRSGLPLGRVSAAFFYVASGQTVRPDGSLDPDRIECTLADAVTQTG